MKEHQADQPPAMEPVHPGEVLREEILPTLDLSIEDAARQLGVTLEAFRPLLEGTASVSAEMALRLGRFCGNGAGFWLRLQSAHDLWHAERDLGPELRKIPVHAATSAGSSRESGSFFGGEKNMAELLAMPDGDEIDFDPPKMEGPFGKPVDFS